MYRTVISIVGLFFLLSQISFAQLENIEKLPNTPDHTDALGGGGEVIQFADGSMGMIYKVQTDYSAGDEGPDRLYVTKSDDAGESWSDPKEIDVSKFHQGIGGLAAAVNTDGRAVMIYFKDTGWSLLYSDDHGESWESSNPPGFGDGSGADLSAGPDGGFAVCQIASRGNGDVILYSTSPDGLEWTSPTEAGNFNGAFLCGNNILKTGEMSMMIFYTDCFFGEGVLPIWQISTTDGGETWSAPMEAITSENSFGKRADVIMDEDGVIWMVHTNREDLYFTFSIDGGQTWDPSIQWTDNSGMGNRPGDLDQDFQPSLTLFNGNPLAAFLARRGDNWFHIYYGILGVSQDPMLTSIDLLKSLNSPGLLQSVSPNPANQETQIGFEIQDAGPVNLSILNHFGQEMYRVLDEILTPGEYQIAWDASVLAPGGYYITLQTGAGFDVQKILIAR